MHAKAYTVAQLAALWQCSDTFIYNQINAGELPAFKLGRKLWRIRHEDVEQYEQRTDNDSNASADTVPTTAPSDVRTAARLLRVGR